MSVTISTTNKPLNPRAQDLSPKGYNRASLYSGKALDFDGVNDEVTTDQNLGDLQTLSVAMHCRVDNMTDGSGKSPISQWNSSYGWMIYKSGGASKLVFYRNGNNFTWDDSITFNNQWIHLVYVIEQGVGAFVYANGELVASDTSYTSNLSYNTSPTVKIGSYGNTSGGFLNGGVSGAKIFNTALTAAQVSDLYLNPEKIVPDGVANSALKLWLPMMEGAGTTAYDGSGNGNHGTISGATWVSGVGAPVAQTALVGWNKGSNLVLYSEQFDDVAWTKNLTSATANQTTSPSGYVDADLIDALTGTGQHFINGVNFSYTTGTAYTFSAFAKKGNTSLIQLFTPFATFGFNAFLTFNFDTLELTTGASATASVVNYGSGWYRLILTATSTASGSAPSFYASFTNDKTVRAPSFTAANETFYLWGAQVTATSDVQPYIPTLATAQTSPVLLPQGLTASKDITGVNSVSRNAYALNLDGASWATVHDNASLDITSAITLECWYYNDGSRDKGLFGRYFSGNTSFLLYAANTSNSVEFFTNTSASIKTNISSGWHHLLGTYDGANRKLYVDGVLEDTDAYTTAISTNSEPIEIGRYFGAPAKAYTNQIALPRIYNRALTATEVARNYNADKSKFGL